MLRSPLAHGLWSPVGSDQKVHSYFDGFKAQDFTAQSASSDDDDELEVPDGRKVQRLRKVFLSSNPTSSCSTTATVDRLLDTCLDVGRAQAHDELSSITSMIVTRGGAAVKQLRSLTRRHDAEQLLQAVLEDIKAYVAREESLIRYKVQMLRKDFILALRRTSASTTATEIVNQFQHKLTSIVKQERRKYLKLAREQADIAMQSLEGRHASELRSLAITDSDSDSDSTRGIHSQNHMPERVPRNGANMQRTAATLSRSQPSPRSVRSAVERLTSRRRSSTPSPTPLLDAEPASPEPTSPVRAMMGRMQMSATLQNLTDQFCTERRRRVGEVRARSKQHSLHQSMVQAHIDQVFSDTEVMSTRAIALSSPFASLRSPGAANTGLERFSARTLSKARTALQRGTTNHRSISVPQQLPQPPLSTIPHGSPAATHRPGVTFAPSPRLQPQPASSSQASDKSSTACTRTERSASDATSSAGGLLGRLRQSAAMHARHIADSSSSDDEPGGDLQEQTTDRKQPVAGINIANAYANRLQRLGRPAKTVAVAGPQALPVGQPPSDTRRATSHVALAPSPDEKIERILTFKTPERGQGRNTPPRQGAPLSQSKDRTLILTDERQLMHGGGFTPFKERLRRIGRGKDDPLYSDSD